MVEYGPVEIGGITHICPIKSVAITMVREAGVNERSAIRGALQTKVNDVLFKQYHLFHAEMRLLTGDNPESEERAHDHGSTGATFNTPETAQQPTER